MSATPASVPRCTIKGCPCRGRDLSGVTVHCGSPTCKHVRHYAREENGKPVCVCGEKITRWTSYWVNGAKVAFGFCSPVCEVAYVEWGDDIRFVSQFGGKG